LIQKTISKRGLALIHRNRANTNLKHFRQFQLITVRMILLGTPNVLIWLLGRQPTSFEAFARREHQKHLLALAN
jgi:hypothetical protein